MALTGIAVPIALSFSLLSLASATPLQAFAAGAALCSTSLGTTFTILGTSGLTATRLGVVLTSAAMMDDVVGLVMVQVILNLGGDNFTPVTVVRPIAVSINLTLWLSSIVKVRQGSPVVKVIGNIHRAVPVHSAILLGLVTGATYAGTSNLFAAYLAGASISWWDSEFLAATPAAPATSAGDGDRAHAESQDEGATTSATPDVNNEKPVTANSVVIPIHDLSSGADTFHRFYEPGLQRVFKPLFFASTGFAIPITELFTARIIWRGIIYTILMLVAKLVTGLWLVRLAGPIFPEGLFKFKTIDRKVSGKVANNKTEDKMDRGDGTGKSPAKGANPSELGIQSQAPPEIISKTSGTPQNSTSGNDGPESTQSINVKHFNRPLSLYPAAMLGTAMTARGEIGFLIASLAETTGVFSSTTSKEASQSSELYLITTWAILLCTIIGPLAVGTLVKRVRRLDDRWAARGGNGREKGPLGIWGVSYIWNPQSAREYQEQSIGSQSCHHVSANPWTEPLNPKSKALLSTPGFCFGNLKALERSGQ